MLEIDGSQGEGGGQILRTSVSLSAVTGVPIRIRQIRARRDRPGLARQHLTAVAAAARVCQAQTHGLILGSTSLTFEPGEIRGGDYDFDVGSAGSATLVLQTILPALLQSDHPSRVQLDGGTHNPWAPPFDFLATAFLPLLRRLGPGVVAQLERPGFFPRGGGRITVHIQPMTSWQGLELFERGEVFSHRVRAAVAHLPEHIAQRECDWITRQSGWPNEAFHMERWDRATGPGNVVLIELVAEHVAEVFTGFGQKGVPAEAVAAAVWREASDYLASGVPVGSHLPDQLLLPMGLAAQAGQSSAFRTVPLSSHARTHIDILHRFLPIRIEVSPQVDGSVVVSLGPSTRLGKETP